MQKQRNNVKTKQLSHPVQGRVFRNAGNKDRPISQKKNFDAEPLSPYSKHLLFFPILAACKKIFQQKRVRH